jgi:hypothetical protein
MGCVLIGLIVAAVLVVVIGGAAALVASSDSGDTTTTTGKDTPAPTAKPPAQDVYKLGQTAHTGDFDITLHQVKDPYTPTNQFETPRPGNRYVAVEMEAKNTSGSNKTLSTLLGAEVTDSLNRPWDIALAGMDLPQLDGDVQAGQNRRGWIVFEVPQDAKGLKLRIKGDFTATGSVFQL